MNEIAKHGTRRYRAVLMKTQSALGVWTRWLPLVWAFLRRHWAVILVTIVMAGTEYTGIRLAEFRQKYKHDVDRTTIYSSLAVRGMPRAHQDEVLYWGNVSALAGANWSIVPGDPYIYEYRNTYTPMPIITIGSLALIDRVFGDPSQAFNFVKIISIVLVTIAVYAAMCYAIGGVMTPLVSAVAVPLFWRLGQSIPLLRGTLTLDVIRPIEWLVERGNAFDQFARIPFSVWTFPVLIAGIALVALALRRETLGPTILAGTGLGVQALTYPYYLTSWGLGLPLLFVWFGVRRNWRSALVLLAVGGISIVVGLPAIVTQLKVSHLPQYQDVLQRLGKFDRNIHWEVAYPLAAFGLILLSGRWVRGLWNPVFLVATAVGFGSLLSMNLNVVTGIDLQGWHWYSRVTLPIATFLGVMIAGLTARQISVRRRMGLRWGYIAPVLAGILVSFAMTRYIGARISAYDMWSPYYVVSKHDAAGYEWLASRDARVATLSFNAEQIRLLQIYGRSFTYLPNGATSVIPHEETMDRFVAAARFYGLSDSTFANLIGLNNNEILYNDLPPAASAVGPPWLFERSQIHELLFHKRYRKRGGGERAYIFPDSVKSDLMERIGRISNPDAALREYRVDYIWQGPFERAMGIANLDTFRDLELAFESGDIRIYRVLEYLAHSNNKMEPSADL
jgi:hypothetical protein